MKIKGFVSTFFPHPNKVALWAEGMNQYFHYQINMMYSLKPETQFLEENCNSLTLKNLLIQQKSLKE